MLKIPETHRDLLSDEIRALAYLATTMPDFSPQVTPVWFNLEGEYILVNSASGRVKDKNMRSRPNVALAICDPQNPYRYIHIRGKVVDVTFENALEHINILSVKYTGHRYHLSSPNQIRVIYKIMPESVSVTG